MSHVSSLANPAHNNNSTNPWLSFLAFLFFLRVFGHWLQEVFSVPILTNSNMWMGSSLPYPILLIMQMCILIGMAHVHIKIKNNDFTISDTQANALQIFAQIYAIASLGRLLLGYILVDHPWFSKPIPALWHFFLAQYCMTLAHVGRKQAHFTGWRSYCVFPTTVLIAVSAFFALEQETQISPFILVNGIVGLSMLGIACLEVAQPYRKDWQPTQGEVRQDCLFLMAIQVVLPKLTVFTTLMLVGLFFNDLLSLGYWSTWTESAGVPVWAQVVVMILTADFFRYWFHRWSHTYSFLWKIHECHHTPNKLYTVNVGRFHVLDKLIHVLLDTVPFLILGVSDEVLSLYFLCYAMNGIFQHCNLPIRYGALNYILSSAELHRWHHSSKRAEAKQNLGNTTIIWDLIFGTYFNPKDKVVQSVGNNTTALKGRLESYLANWYYKIHWALLIRACKDPAGSQEKTLKKILALQAKTVFGQKHTFNRISSADDFSKTVPLQSYDTLEHLNAKNGACAFSATSEKPKLYLKTSGTTQSEKYIPYTKTAYNRLHQQQKLATLHCKTLFPDAFTGQQLIITGASVEGCFSDGTPYGSATGVMREMMGGWLDHNTTLPACISSIQDYQLKYNLIALLSAADQNITHIVTANPSSLVLICNRIDQQKQDIIQTIKTGNFENWLRGHQLSIDLKRQIRTALQKKLQPNPKRSAYLEKCWSQSTTGELQCTDLWPSLALITTWTSGSVCTPLTAFQNNRAPNVPLYDPGYLASEGRFSITTDIESQSGIPMLLDHFYEFIAVDQSVTVEDINSGKTCEIKRLHELEMNQQYYMIITTLSGLYRYCMNDIITVTGFTEKTPLIKFVQKGKGVTNLTGEKLHESQLLKCTTEALRKNGIEAVYIHGIANEKESYYHVYVEPFQFINHNTSMLSSLEKTIDQAICNSNVEYKEKRASSRLKPLKLTMLRQGCYEHYKQHLLNKGQREAQFKTIALGYASANDFVFSVEKESL